MAARLHAHTKRTPNATPQRRSHPLQWLQCCCGWSQMSGAISDKSSRPAGDCGVKLVLDSHHRDILLRRSVKGQAPPPPPRRHLLNHTAFASTSLPTSQSIVRTSDNFLQFAEEMELNARSDHESSYFHARLLLPLRLYFADKLRKRLAGIKWSSC